VNRSCAFTVSADGTEIFYVDHPAGPGSDPGDGPAFLLIHGWAANSLTWGDELIGALTAAGHRVVTTDTRGHGRSAVPASAAPFTTAAFAADVAAVRAAAGLGPVILVGWSYGGLIIADHLAVNGTVDVAAVALIGAITSIGAGPDGPLPGGTVGTSMAAAIPAALSENPGKAIPALGRLRILPAGTDTARFGAVAQQQFGTALATPPRVRGGLFARTVDHDGDLAAWTFPVLVQHGTADEVVALSTGEHNAALLPNAEPSWWDGGGHAPFVEDPQRCAAELLALAARTH
jgi:non-heme chloroperoxidase